MRRFRPVLVVLLALACLALIAGAIHAQRSSGATRDSWQRPAEVMDVLGIAAGSHVADVGCGDGYFVGHLSRRVGRDGIVYGVDVDEDALHDLRRRVERERLENVQVIQGKTDDPLLPAGSLDAVLIVNAYHEMRAYDAMLRAIHSALKPGGRLAIIDAPPNDGSNSSRDSQLGSHTIAESFVRKEAEAAGLRFRSKERGFDRPENSRPHWFFLVFEKL